MTEKRPFNAETGKVLQLMIHSLYTNKDIFLRELISNASDACDKLRYESLQQPELLDGQPELKITISLNKEQKTLTIADSGIGMSEEELIANLGTIARSGTQDFMSRLTGDSQKDMSLIGQFGVGFYASFMVANKVEVVSTRAGEVKTHLWTSDGLNDYSVAPLGANAPRGTAITLHLKEDALSYLDAFRIRHIVETYSDHIAFPIELIDTEGQSQAINTGSALWIRPKNEVTQEQYLEFYRHVAHSPDEPWLTIHAKAEGKLEYNSLLFIPSIQPFDLFHPDRKRRVKLYVKRVFITDEGVELVPAYLRFLRGVIDSEDLPLNISRETLQHNPLLGMIRESITKKILSELKKKAANDAEGYASFWKYFGAVLKEGLCEAQAPREQILENCRFYSTHSDEMVTLDAYLERAKEQQGQIFYLTGDRLEALRNSPQLEGFKKRGIEVLLLTDHVDDFWVNVVPDYKGKRFKSVTRSDINLDDISSLPAEEQTKQEDESNESDDTASLITRLKAIYGEKVKDVRISHKLTDSAVCLAVEEGGMDFRLERFLVEQKQLASGSVKILEINPRHPIITALAKRIAQQAEEHEVEDAALLLLDQARIVEGEEVADPAAFSRRLNECMRKSLAA